ncbi:MAG TPA: hypothetical protein VGJ33_12120 [Candidatus Angelobacter sp.]|jgi:hypothetical protein
MLRIIQTRDARQEVQREIEHIAHGISSIRYTIEESHYGARLLHWRIKRTIVPLIDIALDIKSGSLLYVKLLVNKDVVFLERTRLNIAHSYSGIPQFDLSLWKKDGEMKKFSDQFVDELKMVAVRQSIGNDGWLFVDAKFNGPHREYMIDSSLSIMADESSCVQGVFIQGLSRDEARLLEPIL